MKPGLGIFKNLSRNTDCVIEEEQPFRRFIVVESKEPRIHPAFISRILGMARMIW